MKEQLYTIPVMDAFSTDCECPVCAMQQTLEQNALEYTMGPSYMEDDIRAKTDEMGFCQKHISILSKHSNRLGLALILHTHMKKTIIDLENLNKKETSKKSSPSFFKKKETSEVTEYIKKVNQSCFVCSKVEQTFERYITTILYLYKKDLEFREIFSKSKGFCTTHYGALYDTAPNELTGDMLNQFLSVLNQIYLTNMKRVCDDLEWFTDKFDYRNADAPWKNSKDALPRSITKLNSILETQE